MATLPLVTRRHRLPDPRIGIGVALVLVSALGVTGIVAGLNRTVAVYRADQSLVAGDRITAADLAPTSVRLGDAQRLYLTGPLPADGLIVTRTIEAGEIVPRSALGTLDGVQTATVVVDLAVRPAGGVDAGTVVDLWSAPRKTGTADEYGAPVVLVSGATLKRLVPVAGLSLGGQQNTVEVQVPRDDVAAVLQAAADDSRISAVAVSAPVGR